MDIPQAYKSVFLEGNIDYIPLLNLAEDDKSLLENGIYFVMARWSGSSQLSFRALNQAISTFGNRYNLPIFIIDTDSDAATSWFKLVGDTPGGYGETYLVKDNDIVSVFKKYKSDSLDALVKEISKIL